MKLTDLLKEKRLLVKERDEAITKERELAHEIYNILLREVHSSSAAFKHDKIMYKQIDDCRKELADTKEKLAVQVKLNTLLERK